MMRPSSHLAEVYPCLDPIDFRKQINGLAAMVVEVLSLDPFGEQLFVFTNRRRDSVKILYWEANGFVLWMKRLERERFHWPRGEGALPRLSGQQLKCLLDGFDHAHWRPHRRLHYDMLA